MTGRSSSGPRRKASARRQVVAARSLAASNTDPQQSDLFDLRALHHLEVCHHHHVLMLQVVTVEDVASAVTAEWDEILITPFLVAALIARYPFAAAARSPL
jgi:hypothetical protein